jgi:2-oxoglutarate ferredoxin oxidoreductase subunit beta
VTFNNTDESMHSYAWGKDHEVALHELSYVPPREDIMVEYAPGEVKDVIMHDGSSVVLKKLELDYDPTDRNRAIIMLEEANRKNLLITGLIYIDTKQPSLIDILNLTDKPLNRLTPDQIRPSRESIDQINSLMF